MENPVKFVMEIISWGLLLSGGFFVITGAVGMLRMPDFFTRLHPAGITDSLGMPLILVGLMVHNGLNLLSLKIFVLILFLLLTSPTSCHALARAALFSGQKPLAEIPPRSKT